jgi:hypothetical protein
MNRYLSRHVDCDRHSLYEFTRNTRIPHGTFSPRFHWSTVALWAATVVIALCLVGAAT